MQQGAERSGDPAAAICVVAGEIAELAEHCRFRDCEHGGEPDSVEFCHRQGFDYVSCSPYRVPIARLAASRIAPTIPGRAAGMITWRIVSDWVAPSP